MAPTDSNEHQCTEHGERHRAEHPRECPQRPTGVDVRLGDASEFDISGGVIALRRRLEQTAELAHQPG